MNPSIKITIKPKRRNFQASGLRFNEQEQAQKENSKPVQSLKASGERTGKDRYWGFMRIFIKQYICVYCIYYISLCSKSEYYGNINKYQAEKY